MNRNDYSPDVHDLVHLIAKGIMKKINSINSIKHLQVIVSRFNYHQVGTKAFYEMLAIEFVKTIDKFPLRIKCRMINFFAQSNMDSSYILKTIHKLCASYAEALACRPDGVLS